MPLAFALSACTTVQLNYAPNCFREMVGEDLRKNTPHAPLPTEATAGAWVDQANKEAGQTDKANARARTITHIGDTCDRWAAEAKEELEEGFFERLFG